MPGSWEIQQNKVLCAFLHTDLVSVPWALGFRNLLPHDMPIMPIAGMPFDHARNTACRTALDNGFEYLFFLDSDVVPPRDVVQRLMNHKKPWVSGVYFRRSPPHSVPVMIKNGTWYTNYPRGALVDVDLVGAGCLLIHRSFLEAIPPQRPHAGKHWFDWRVDTQGMQLPPDMPPLSEDFTLCHWAKVKLGIPTLVDTSIVCRHIGLAQAGDNTFTPAEANPIT
ncbi:hypothetical protein C4577_01755 [Candidatus Parcubacteria bacterium]|nr:MAG: hypothetical protein C4577_01755 [Candidatus Parcubacteria bacterium]